ncbi:MAG: tetratricopeptide repeat protein [Oscillospiraceae bacterium]|nr:tetratricopeptide repeat protein [Oscillospiraceae bacterium]
MSIRRFFDGFWGRQEAVAREPEYLTSLPVPTDNDYPLRTRQEEQLYQALCQRGSHILLHGPGGTGKTHMARKLFYRLSREYPRLAWVEYGTGIRHSMSRSAEETSGNPEQWFEEFITKLEAVERDTILFIDDAKEDAVDDAALAQITGMGITILMTSRCPEISPYETWELAPLTAGDCADLFYANYYEDTRKQYRRTVLTLADRLERNVFAILLLANVAGTPENLPKLEKRLREGTLMDHVGQLIDASHLTVEQDLLLRCLALTNSGELNERLVHWLEFHDSDAEELIRKGWLVRNEKTECLVLHDLVREYYNRETPGQQTVERFIKGALGETFHARAKAHASATFKGKVIDFQLRALEIMEQCWNFEEELACAYDNVGLSLLEFGDRRRTLEYMGKALTIRERVVPPNHLDLAASYNNVGYVYSALGDHAKYLEYAKKALAICERVLPPDHPELATSYNNVGSAYGELGDHTKALEYAKKALTIRERVLPLDYPDLAQSYNNVGYTYSDLGDHAKALEYTEKALTICERVLPSDHPNLATSYNNVGYTYGKLGNRDKELEYYYKALSIQERALPPNHPDIAMSCNNIAWTHAQQGHYSEALEWMRRAMEIAECSLSEEHPDRRKYREAVKKLEQRC